MLSVVIQIVANFYCYAEFNYDECGYVKGRYAECSVIYCYVECRYAECCGTKEMAEN
jgi:hypothetical protein